MNVLGVFRTLMFAWLCNCMASAELVSRTQIAGILGYPSDRLTTSDLTKESQQRYGADVLAAYKIESSDGGFAPIIFIAAKKGLILTPEMEAQFKQATQTAPAAGVKPTVRRIPLLGDAYGYIGLGGTGPGGSEEMVIATLPSKGIDVQVKIVLPSEELTSVPGGEAYHQLLVEGGERLARQLIECTKLTVAAAARLPSPGATPQPQQSVTPPAATPTRSTPVPSATPASSTPAPTIAESPVPVVERQAPVWPWVVGILALVVIVAVALKRRA